MRRRTRRALLFAVGIGVTMVALGRVDFAQAGNPLVGTWRLNILKSRFSPGPAPRSSTMTIEAAGTGLRYTVDQVSSTGAKIHWEFAGAYDGRDNKVTGDNPNGDTAAITRIDARTIRQVNKLAGKITTTQVAILSAAGQVRTVTTTGTNAQGQSVSDVAVYEKQ